MRMVLLESFVDRLDFSREIETVDQLLEKASPGVSFLGDRAITVPDMDGFVLIDVIETLVNEAAKLRAAQDDLSMVERAAGLRILEKIKNFHAALDGPIARPCEHTPNLERPDGASIPSPDFFSSSDYSNLCFQMMTPARYAREKADLPGKMKIIELDSNSGHRYRALLVSTADIFERAQQKSS